MDTLHERITNATLTKKEQIVAEYIVNNSSTACFMTAADMAQQLGISDSSVVRLARALGFSGFNDLKKFVQAEISQQFQSRMELSVLTPSERLQQNMNRFGKDQTIEKVLDSSIAHIKDVLLKNSTYSFSQAIDLLLNSQRKYIMGFRTSAQAASVMGFLLNPIVPGVTTSIDADARAVETLVDISSRDCLMLFAFPRYGKMCRIVYSMAKEKGAKIIAVTDKLTSPIANNVDVVFTVGVDSISYFNSSLPAVFLAEALCAALCQEHRIEENQQRLDLINRFIAPDEMY